MAITHTTQHKSARQAGVTLIELIVVIGIFAVVSSVLMFNYSDFSNGVSIRNLSQDIALSIRKAQTYATSVQIIDGVPQTTQTFPSYGLSFSLENSGQAFNANKKEFVLFADLIPSGDSVPNKKYDNDGTCGAVKEGTECLEKVSITSADSIVGLETDVTGPVITGTVNITFRRPSPDAIICYIPSGESDCIPQAISYAKILLQSVKGTTKTVSVWNTGQINVQ